MALRRILLSGSATVANADQWLALHTAESPIATKVGCYAYVPAAQADGRSIMYAVAEPAGAGNAGKPAEILLVASFANSAADADAKIAQLDVVETPTAEQRALVAAANKGGQCSSGYAPKLIFGH
jgi:hypothetical protein